MEELLIQCSPGISGDMFLSALFDLGVPKTVIEEPLKEIGLDDFFSLSFDESKSYSLRGIIAKVKVKDNDIKRDWKTIRKMVSDGKLKPRVKKLSLRVFESLAFAEGAVHGINPEEVHFHEIGGIDSIVDIIGVCSAINYLNPSKIYCNSPNLGNGFAQTDHGRISIPSPAVIELLKQKKIAVNSSSFADEGELSTPTGISLLLNLADAYSPPSQYCVKSYGVGIGQRDISYPNIFRLLEIDSLEGHDRDISKGPKFEKITIQEAWIDDQSPEDVSNFVEILRKEGAYDVAYQSIFMKKNRIGFWLTAIVPVEEECSFRNLWFKYTGTLGLRERRQGRWTLPRRIGECMTVLGVVRFKQTINNNGEILLKPENDEIKRLQMEHKKTAQEIRTLIDETIDEFQPYEDWS